MNRVDIKIPGFEQYALKYLRRLDIDVYNVEYRDSSNVYTIALSDLEKLNLENVEIVSYRGIKRIFLKLFIYRYFLMATFLSLVVMFLTSMFVVEIEVIHSNSDIRILLEEELYDNGIRPFTLKKSFSELQEIKNRIKSTYKDDIEWLEIVDEGMKYTVRVEERIITREEDKPKFCNVISIKDAIVLSTNPKSGQVVVAPNDFVRAGDILISGSIKLNEETKGMVCAEGEVYGNAWYRVATSIPMTHINKNYTGRKKYNVGLEIGSTYNRIFKVHFENYDVEKKRLFGFGKFAIYKEIISEYIEEEGVYSEEEALDAAREEAHEKILVKLGDKATILSEKVLQTDSYDSIMNVEIFYSVKEIIGERREAEPEIIMEESAEKKE